MARIACLWVPDLPVAALLRLEPELGADALAVVDGEGMRGRVLAVSAPARAAGVAPGMTAVQARAICHTLVVRTCAAETLDAAHAALADVAETIGPHVEIGADGAVFLDCTGSAALCASESELASVLGARAERQGLPARVGIASSKTVAAIAARVHEDTARIVPPGATATYLAARSIALLEPTPALAATLASWGLERIGDLVALPPGPLAHRLGPDGARLARRARGEDDGPVASRPRPACFVEAADLDHAVEHLESLVFVLRRLVDRMTARLGLHGLACEALDLRLRLDGGGEEQRVLTPAAPTAESKTLLLLLRSRLEQRLPARGVIGLSLAGRPAAVRPTQIDFFRPTGPSPTRLAATLARLTALCGADRVGAPRRPDSHRPDAVELVTFTDDGRDTPSPPGTPLSSPTTRVALRAFRPPLMLEVFESRGRLEYVRGRGLGGRVVHAAGPWVLCGEWWSGDPFGRAYWDVELSDGGVYRIYRDARTAIWKADGMYD